MPGVTAAGSLPLQLEAYAPSIAEAMELTGKLDTHLGGASDATRVSLRSFRVRLQVDVPSNYQYIGLDSGTMPLGTGSGWDQMLLTPVSYTIPVQYSQLAQQMEGPGVATNSAVSKTIADVVRSALKIRDIQLQTPGDGSLATVESVNGNTINLRSNTTATVDGRGAHLVQRQQTVQIMSPAYLSRGTCTISTVYNKLGQTQAIVVDAVPAGNGGVQAGDLVMVAGLAEGAPQGVNGIPYFISTLTTGNMYGINRANPYVVANGINLANASQVTKPVFRLLENQIVQCLGDEGLKNQFYHTHSCQTAALEELAFADTYAPLDRGKAGAYDPLFDKSKMTLNGRPIIDNPHSDMTRWDLMLKEVWKEIKWGAGAFWFKTRSGQMVFNAVDPATGTPTMAELMYWVLAYQKYVSNPMAQGCVTGAKVPTGY